MKITIGYTKTFRQGWKGSTIDYVPAMDGYHDGAEQDLVTIEVESPTMDPAVVGEAIYCATNAPAEIVARDPLAAALQRELIRAQNAGPALPHRLGLDVGDTIRVDDEPLVVVASCGFEIHTPGQVTCGR